MVKTNWLMMISQGRRHGIHELRSFDSLFNEILKQLSSNLVILIIKKSFFKNHIFKMEKGLKYPRSVEGDTQLPLSIYCLKITLLIHL